MKNTPEASSLGTRGLVSIPEGATYKQYQRDDSDSEVETEEISRDHSTHTYCYLSSIVPSCMIPATFVRVYREAELSDATVDDCSHGRQTPLGNPLPPSNSKIIMDYFAQAAEYLKASFEFIAKLSSVIPLWILMEMEDKHLLRILSLHPNPTSTWTTLPGGGVPETFDGVLSKGWLNHPIVDDHGNGRQASLGDPLTPSKSNINIDYFAQASEYLKPSAELLAKIGSILPLWLIIVMADKHLLGIPPPRRLSVALSQIFLLFLQTNQNAPHSTSAPTIKKVDGNDKAQKNG